jgi:4-amino-4-deoxy-L-arabinose transferase-like glycosyltransferase
VLCVVPAALSRGRGDGAAWQGAREARLFWAWWLSATALIFSAMGGPMHPYYTVLMAPAIAALTGAGLVDLWRAASAERQLGAGAVLAVALAGSGLWAAHIAWPRLPLGAGIVLMVLLTPAVACATAGQRQARTGAARVGAVLVGSVVVSAMLAGPVAYSLATDAHTVTGANPLAGPYGGRRPVVYPPALVAFLKARAGDHTWAAVTPRATAASALALASRRPVLTLGGFTGRVPFPTLALFETWVRLGRVRYLVVPVSAVAAPATTGAVGSEADRIIRWGATHGCRVALPVTLYVVEDLAGHSCPAFGAQQPSAP